MQPKPKAYLILIGGIMATAIIVAWVFLSNAHDNESNSEDDIYRKTHPIYAYTISGGSSCCLPSKASEHPLRIQDRRFLFNLYEHYGVNLLGKGDGDQVFLVSFSPKGNYLAIVMGYTNVIVWNTVSKREQSRFEVVNGSDFNKIIWSPDERFLTFGRVPGPNTKDSASKVWEVQTGLKLAELKGHTLFSAISPNGKKIVSRVHNISNEYNEFKPGAFSWRIYNTDNWSYYDIDEYYLHLCGKKADEQFSYNAVTWVSDRKFVAFGKWTSHSKERVCGYKNSEAPVDALFAAPFDVSGMVKWPILPVTLDEKSVRSQSETISDFFYTKNCRYEYNISDKKIFYARGLIINTDNYSVRNSVEYYNAFMSCNFYDIDSSGRYIYGVDVKNAEIPGSQPVGKVHSIHDGALLSTFPVSTGHVIGGIDVSPDDSLLAVTSYNSVDIYRLKTSKPKARLAP